ncbi:RNA polymerase sigma factor [Amycolatopsis alkalitolerans]|uniref:Sigma-70 family RNA polymerase sigma factor n=1 Tax=Amycolatopsis alkalitolerans TaxID=2547244 RepID=A0A5C4LWR6_9PSEU|nr:sigma-70 family RNA polymerase sigma factor [Amycolatopsis alkalitolerans]TNC22252.1 sigma-70 family RNA polymerase sigma factor [Amycolatopsis alkalitolerans]
MVDDHRGSPVSSRVTPNGPAGKSDENALTSFLQSRWEELYQVILRRTGDYHTAEDVRQKTALGFTMRWRTRGPMEKNDRAPMLYRIALNKIAEECRNNARWTDIVAMQNQLAPHCDLGAEEDVLAVLDRIELAGALSGLTLPQRHAIVLTCIDGFDQQTAADLMGISKSTFRKHRDAAKAKLSRYFTNRESGEEPR